jgi:hypothetical protein
MFITRMMLELIVFFSPCRDAKYSVNPKFSWKISRTG